MGLAHAPGKKGASRFRVGGDIDRFHPGDAWVPLEIHEGLYS